MQTIQKLLPRGAGLAPALRRRAATAELDWDTRQRSRFQLRDSTGRDWAVFLPRGRVVRGGDVLVGEDGSLVQVQAAAQPVMVVRACPEHGTPLDLVRAAYHLGNRHVSLAIAEDHLTFEPDHVLADMLRQMHLRVTETLGPFEPEAGAYHTHGTGHDHAEHAAPAGDGREQGHDHAHGHGHAHPHEAGQGCAHDHDHGHAHGHGH